MCSSRNGGTSFLEVTPKRNDSQSAAENAAGGLRPRALRKIFWLQEIIKIDMRPQICVSELWRSPSFLLGIGLNVQTMTGGIFGRAVSRMFLRCSLVLFNQRFCMKPSNAQWLDLAESNGQRSLANDLVLLCGPLLVLETMQVLVTPFSR